MITRHSMHGNRYIPWCSGKKNFPLWSVDWYKFIVVSTNRAFAWESMKLIFYFRFPWEYEQELFVKKNQQLKWSISDAHFCMWHRIEIADKPLLSACQSTYHAGMQTGKGKVSKNWLYYLTRFSFEMISLVKENYRRRIMPPFWFQEGSVFLVVPFVRRMRHTFNVDYPVVKRAI